MIKLKTVILKQGEINSYINEPVLDRVTYNAFDSKAIGIITDAIEVDNGLMGKSLQYLY